MTFARFLYYSFPVRILVLHLRNHLMLIALWVVMAMLTSGYIGRFFGVHYLLLTPEYLGRVDFWSFFIHGLAFGWLFKTWNLTSYLLVANRFPFLATLKAPFTKFSINNSILPLAFFVFYLVNSIRFQWLYELSDFRTIAINIGGFVAGFIVLVFFLSGYLFFTNKDIYAFMHLRRLVPKEGGRLFVPGQRLPTLHEIRSGITRYRVDYYLSERLKWRHVRNVAHYDREILGKVFQQNHLNAVLIQVTSLLFLMALGLFMESSWARIPAGATVFILCALFIASFGALIFWFRHWGTLVFLFMAVVLNYLTGLELFNYRSRAFGIEYTEKKAYSYDALQALCTDTLQRADRAETLQMLEAWAAKNQKPHGKKPKMVLMCFSGGGLRSAQWSMQSLAQINAATSGNLLKQTALMTGASGGMYGAAYYRNLSILKPAQELFDLAKNQDSLLLVSSDLLNPITFAIISNDLFYPLTRVKIGNQFYRRDRGYMLEKALTENTNGVLAGKIGDYKAVELKAQVPMLVYAPYILNDGRKMLIGAQKLSYLMRPTESIALHNQLEIDGVDFGRLFETSGADSLLTTSALRMNSTYPLILPNVWLPTHPSIELMDAGLRDNYGVSTAVRFAHVFSEWIKENTSGVIVIQVRCWEKIDPIQKSDSKGMVEDLIGKATVAGMMTTIEDYRQDSDLSLLSSILGAEHLDVVRLIYQPMRKESEASLSFHLSKRERMDILNAYFRPENLREVERLKQLMR